MYIVFFHPRRPFRRAPGGMGHQAGLYSGLVLLRLPDAPSTRRASRILWHECHQEWCPWKSVPGIWVMRCYEISSLALKWLFAWGFHIGFAWGNTIMRHIWRLDFGEFGEYKHVHRKRWSFISPIDHSSQRWILKLAIEKNQISKLPSGYLT